MPENHVETQANVNAAYVAHLRAEVERLRRSHDSLQDSSRAKIKGLLAEVERLRELADDEELITRLYEAHGRGDVRSFLREALDA